MSHEGKTQITALFTADAKDVAEGDRIFASHAAWMKKGHHHDGERALLRYNVARGPELSNDLDPSSAPTGRTTFALTEVYESPAGVEDHWGRVGTWEDFGAFADWAGQCDVVFLHGSPIEYSLW